MALVLSLETATRNCSVGLSRDGETIALKEHAGQGYEHAEKLHLFIQNVLNEARVSFTDLDAIAVSRGPGSYTGLRIGVSAAKGLCVALDKPLITIDTLQVLAAAAKIDDGIIIPMIDARRMEVYCAAYDGKSNQISPSEALILEAGSFDRFSGNLYFVGDSNVKAQTVLNDGRFHFLDGIEFPSAHEMSWLAYDKFVKGQIEDVAYFEPFYLKDFKTS
ncbi:tRNA (adenosine(37)-N6)-threonylcarbamoyltransferase complex dimerization subunit type 1 TsaB [Flavobacterium silvaticum]|uniref:tRNA (Adenosine(37)-N6)-threonylcarbamoyltransferase complex dimerization subunit type 1 TsaB n=1 Tax=Flavobacterium silvaticum TaxID=1852020 RepID=A0A972FK21_9FLAO|nr:tRNA (adenosine(37)-N6)-threonylcarbamoyltransferase complex dimerization subunit type 1 TsaB [Flavobacterium silvaticum]NMH27122.1 tRNA (adenosine(37)-N6)-threonylcarbamoyltransferase complex dimerization subunit type 1 TsaB [Flavobacterium silvaticum]